MEGMIRVGDFAKKVGCTNQNIYKHLRTYAKELEGHVYEARRGKVLDEYAQEFIRSVMYPKELGEPSLVEEINSLRQQLFLASQETAKLVKEKTVLEAERDKALLDAGENQRLLQASTEDLTEAREEAQKALQEAAEAAEREKATLAALEAEKAENEALKAKYDALKKRNLLDRILNRGV